MTFYYDPDKSTYKWIGARPFTRIHEKPTWDQVERLHEEAEDVAMDCDVSYSWSNEHGLLAEILGPVKYLAGTTLVYVEPTKPPNQHALIVNGVRRHLVVVYANENNLLLHDWAIVTGFRRGVCENFRDALDPRYYEQLKQPICRYKRIQPLQYINHIKAHWVFLDNKKIDELTK